MYWPWIGVVSAYNNMGNEESQPIRMGSDTLRVRLFTATCRYLYCPFTIIYLVDSASPSVEDSSLQCLLQIVNH